LPGIGADTHWPPSGCNWRFLEKHHFVFKGDLTMSRVLAVCLLAIFIVPVVFAEELTPIDRLERGMSATIQGEVTRILDEDEFRIRDKTGSIRVYTGWKNRVYIPIGETIIVRGFVDDDLKAYFRPEFYAFEIIREDGSVIELNYE
jgi:hypothetical protein